MGVQRYAVGLLAATFFALQGPVAAASAAEQIKNSVCLDCHADKRLTKTNAAGKEVSLFVDVAKLAATVHKRAQLTVSSRRVILNRGCVFLG